MYLLVAFHRIASIGAVPDQIGTVREFEAKVIGLPSLVAIGEGNQVFLDFMSYGAVTPAYIMNFSDGQIE